MNDDHEMTAGIHKAAEGEGVVFDDEIIPAVTAADKAVIPTASPTSNTLPGIAAQKVFDIPELLEQILLNLDPITLYVTQRVSTSFKDAVSSSTKIKQRMTPSGSPDCRILQEIFSSDKMAKVLSPLVVNAFGSGDVVYATESTEPWLVFRLEPAEDLFESVPKQRPAKRWAPKEGTAYEDNLASWNKIKVNKEGVPVQVHVQCLPKQRDYWLQRRTQITLHEVLGLAWHLFGVLNDDGELYLPMQCD